MNNAINNIYFANTIHAQTELSPWELLPEFILMTFLLLGFHRVLFQKKKFHHGKKRRQERRKKTLPLTLKTPITRAFTVSTVDISLNGAFLNYEDLEKNRIFMKVLDEDMGTMKVGDLIDVEIPLGPFNKINCQARLIRLNFSDHGIPPRGMAIEFIHLSESQQKELSLLIFDKNEVQAA